MGWNFRRSVKFGPIRLNFSKSGIGTSLGVRGFRVGKDAKGRTYTATSIPGTGIYNRKYSAAGASSAQPRVVDPTVASSAMGNGLKLFIGFITVGLVFMVVGAFTSSSPTTPSPTPAAATISPLTQPVSSPKRRRRGPRRVDAQGRRPSSVIRKAYHPPDSLPVSPDVEATPTN